MITLFLKQKLLGVPFPYKTYRVNTETFNSDPLARSIKLEKHFHGEFSMASIQSNKDMEDFNQVDVSPTGLFVGIYDGFKGNAAASFIRTHFLKALLGRIELNFNHMTLSILREVVDDIEDGFIQFASKNFEEHQNASIGLVSSGCLICIIWKGILYLANVGNSRAVLGFTEDVGISEELRVMQLVRDHSCGNLDIKKELGAMFPGDNTICQFTEVQHVHNYHTNKDPSWTVKGLIETSRCIGYAYLKKAMFTMGGSFKIPVREQVVSARPVLTSEPDLCSRVLQDSDKFIIFGSSGFWKLMSNERAAAIVNSSPRDDIAKILAIIAIGKGAGKKKKKYSDIVRLPKGEDTSGSWGMKPEKSRPVYHDDMTVIVVFFDKRPSGVMPEINCYSCSDVPDMPSAFTH